MRMPMRAIPVVALFSLLAAAFLLSGCSSLGKRGPYRAGRVVDGTTIEVLYQGRPTPIHIDSLEAVPLTEGNAIVTLDGLVRGRDVWLSFPSFGRDRDSLGRLRAEVYVDGRNVADELVAQGLAERQETVSEPVMVAAIVIVVAAAVGIGLALGL